MDFGLNQVFLFPNIFFNITHEGTQILLESISHEVQELSKDTRRLPRKNKS